jgi:tyrosine-protein kinase Etk/Wzc
MPNALADHSKNPVDYPADDDDGIDLGKLLDVLVHNKWLIIATTLGTLSLGIAKTFLDRPVYKADGLLQVKENLQSLSTLGPGTSLLDIKSPILAEIELIKSRMILGKAVNNLRLDIIAKPKYFPIIGEPIARQRQKQPQNDAVLSPMFGQNHYAWGGEEIKVNTFKVPSDLEDKEFILQAGIDGQFKLIHNDEIVLEGEVGKLASKQLGNGSKPISIFVSLLKSRPDGYFTVLRRSGNQAITQLNDNISFIEKGKSTGILEINVESHSPDSATTIVNEVANIYMQQNVDQKSAESQKTLEFLDKQLPILKEQMDAASATLNEYRIRQGSIDLSLETQNILKEAVDIKTQITILQQKRDELRQRYTELHPSIISTDKQIARLHGQMTSHDKNIEILPETQQVILRLSRDVEVSTELYSTLLNSAQTLRLAKAGTVGNVRIIDYAVLPDGPIKPRKTLIIGIAFIVGLILGLVAVFIRKSLALGVEDPDLIEQQLSLPVYSTILHSRYQEKLDIKVRNLPSNSNLPIVLGLENKEDIAIESLRSLRTTLHFAFLEARNNIILITGPTPNVGKTFVAANLAIVMADAGKKVLLIDGDLRRGSMNVTLGVPREHGVSELIMNTISIESAIHKITQANIDFIPTGAIPPNPSELLLHERFGFFLESVSKKYDLVIIDSPPVLAVTDATIIGRLATATLMVIKAGEHPMRELEQSTRRLIQGGVNLKGIVFNNLPQLASRRGGYGKYVYQYSYKSKK